MTQSTYIAATPPDAFLQAVTLFNQRRFFQCHEVLEDDLWRPETDPNLRAYYQGLLQIAVGYVHAQRNNPIGMASLLGKGHEKLESLHRHHTAPTWVSLLPLLHTAERHHTLALTETTGLVTAIDYPQLQLTNPALS